jgi:serine/threonine-protein kinase
MIGQTISHYQILEKLGEGGMGIVYKAEDTKLRRSVALKFLPPTILVNEDDRRRFVHEAQASAALSHPNIATVFEIDESGAQTFIALEYIDGQSLAEMIKSGPLKLDDAIPIAIQLCEGLQAAHEKGIVHRDIKSQNVMVTIKGQVKILDFGLAKLRGVSVVTKAGTTVGTMGYMSPEQLRGESVDHRTDIWAVGVVLYEMIAGRRPFQGDYDEAISYQIINQQPEPLTAIRTGVPMELERIVSKTLTKDKEGRYQHIDDLLADLRTERKKSDPETTSYTSSSRDARGTTRRSFAKAAMMAAALIIVFLAIYLFYPPSTTIPTNRKSIAVLPFKNFSDSKEDEYFADGVTEDIITQLSKIADLKVISRTSVMQYKGMNKNIREVGRELNVGAVLEGSIRRAGNQIRIVAQLIDANNEGHLWAETYDKELTQIFVIQSDVAQNIASALKSTLLPGERVRIQRTQTINAEAYQNYLKGRFYWNKRTVADIQTAIEYFQKAILADTNFALAYTGLASAYATITQYGLSAHNYIPMAIAFARKGLELDSTSAEAHAVLALCKKNYEWDWAGAEREYKRAIELNPGYAGAHQWYSIYLTCAGRLDEAMKEIKIALVLDPLSLVITSNVAGVFYNMRQYDDAVDGIKKTLQLDPSFVDAQTLLGLIYSCQNRSEEAIVVLKKVRSTVGNTPKALSELGQTYARAERNKEALATLDTLLTFSKKGYSISWGIASIYCALGEKDKSFQWLEKACQDREVRIGQLKVEPIWDEIRSDSRFLALLKKIGLEK